MNEHHLIPDDFFTSEQWHEPMARYIFALVEKPGGVLLISVEVAPERRHYPLVSFAVFDAQERKALRAAFLKAEKKREAVPSHTAPGKAPLCDALSHRPLGGRVARSVDSTA
jgi:hypothetical protein